MKINASRVCFICKHIKVYFYPTVYHQFSLEETVLLTVSKCEKRLDVDKLVCRKS